MQQLSLLPHNVTMEESFAEVSFALGYSSTFRRTSFDVIVHSTKVNFGIRVSIPDDNGHDRVCLVIAVAKASEAMGARTGDDAYIYPIRRGLGTVRVDRHSLQNARIHEKNDCFSFLDRLEQFVTEA